MRKKSFSKKKLPSHVKKSLAIPTEKQAAEESLYTPTTSPSNGDDCNLVSSKRRIFGATKKPEQFYFSQIQISMENLTRIAFVIVLVIMLIGKILYARCRVCKVMVASRMGNQFKVFIFKCPLCGSNNVDIEQFMH